MLAAAPKRRGPVLCDPAWGRRRWWLGLAAVAVAATGFTAARFLTQADARTHAPVVRPVFRVLTVGSAVSMPEAAPYLGLSYLPAPAGDPQGTLPGLPVAEVAPHSPAAAAGLRSGDLLLAINGGPVARAAPILELLRSYQPGQTVTLTVSRGGEQWDVSATLTASPR